MIFNVQSIRVQRPLLQYFEFLFVDAPFVSYAGPGVLPTFEGCEPFLSWITQHGGRLPFDSKKAIDDAIRGKEKDIVGIMGFSQGAKVGAGLLLMQQIRQNLTGNEVDFKFGVFCMGVTPPMVTEEFWDQREEIISIPSLHIAGKQDEYFTETKKLYHRHFDDKFSSLIELDVGHRLPLEEDQNSKIVEGIKALYVETTGKALIDFRAV